MYSRATGVLNLHGSDSGSLDTANGEVQEKGATVFFLNVCGDALVCAEGSKYALIHRLEDILNEAQKYDVVCLAENRNYPQGYQYETLMLEALEKRNFSVSFTRYNMSKTSFSFICAVQKDSLLSIEQEAPIYVYEDNRWHKEMLLPDKTDKTTRCIAPFIIRDANEETIVLMVGHAPVQPTDIKQKYMDEIGKHSVTLREEYNTRHVLIALDANLFPEEDPMQIYRFLDPVLENHLCQIRHRDEHGKHLKLSFRPYPLDAQYVRSMLSEGSVMDVMFANPGCVEKGSAKGKFLATSKALDEEEIPPVDSDERKLQLKAPWLASDHMMLTVRLNHIHVPV